MYLEPVPGEAGVNNILKMARDGLRRDLTTALHKASVTKATVRCESLRIKTNGHYTVANLVVCPLPTHLASASEDTLYLVILEEIPGADATGAPGAVVPPLWIEGSTDANVDARITALKQELRAKEEYLQTTNEELETSNEELKSSNEEMQSINEELQSSNEELETSKEELQSVNEELATVNAELQTKVTDLSQANNDMNNLLAGTGIATIFVDHQLRILRFTPAATRIINMILSDVGRPVRHIVSNLVGYDSLVTDAQEVLDSLTPKEIEVETTEGNWYTMRIRPYRTLDNVIEGAVITFFDITETKRAQEMLKRANEQLRLAIVVRDSQDAILMLDLDGRIMAWNLSAQKMFGWSEAEALSMNIRDMLPSELRDQELNNLLRVVKDEAQAPYATKRMNKDGRTIEVWLTATAMLDNAGRVYAIATTERAGLVRGDP